MSDIKRIGMITLSNAAAHMQMQTPLLRAKGRKAGRIGLGSILDTVAKDTEDTGGLSILSLS